MTETERDIAILEVQVPKAKLHVQLVLRGSKGMRVHILPLDMKKFPRALTLVPGQAEFILNFWERLRSREDNIAPINSFLQYEMSRFF